MKTIKANVMYDWNREQNPGCRFLPGDLVCVRGCDTLNRYNVKNGITKKEELSERALRAYNQGIGRIIAVTTTDGKRIRGDSPTGKRERQFTRYYVKFMDGEIFGYHSHYLQEVPLVP